ncbi:hypothetical protein N2152v2_009257, partial [Parachlorella kessleri]
MQFPGLDLVHPETPVFVCHGLLTDAECEAIIAAASANQLPEIEYDNSMLLDTQRLWPLALVAMAGAGFDSWQHNLALDGHTGLGEVAVAVSASFAKDKVGCQGADCFWRTGQYQRAHYDGRPAGDPDGLKEFMQAGRPAADASVVYLNTLTPEQQRPNEGDQPEGESHYFMLCVCKRMQ